MIAVNAGGRPPAPISRRTRRWWEDEMDGANLAFLILVLVAMGSFMAVLAWATATAGHR